MAPFDRHEVKSGFKNDNQRTLRNNRGLDTLDYKGNFCYEYEELLFDGMTPGQFIEVQALEVQAREDLDLSRSAPIPHEALEHLGWVSRASLTVTILNPNEAFKDQARDYTLDDSGKLTVKKDLVKVLVGVVLPHVAPSGVSTFELCQDGECVKAGQVSTFGSTTKQADKPSEQQIDENNYYIAETEVTAVMDKQGWTVEKDLEAKMTYSMVGNLPQPVVIVPGRRVILSPKEKRSHYGNLLDGYDI